MTKIQRGARDAWVLRIVEAGGRGPVVPVAHALAKDVWTTAGWSVPYVDVTAASGCHRATVVRAVALLRAAGALRAEARSGPAGNAAKHYTLVLAFDVEVARIALGGRPKPAGKRPPRSHAATTPGRTLRPTPGRQERPLPSPDPDLSGKTPPEDHRMTQRVRRSERVAVRSAYEYAASAVRQPATDPGLGTEDCVDSQEPGDPEQRARVEATLARLAAGKKIPAANGSRVASTLEQLVARALPDCPACRGSGLVLRGSTGLPCSCTSR